eukprot:3448915-Amphidinium_carterae.1
MSLSALESISRLSNALTIDVMHIQHGEKLCAHMLKAVQQAKAIEPIGGLVPQLPNYPIHQLSIYASYAIFGQASVAFSSVVWFGLLP